MAKFKILQVAKYYFPYRRGMESVTQSLSEGLAKSGMEVTVLCSMERRWSSMTREIEGVNVVKVPQVGVIASQPLTPTWPDVYKDLAQEADLIHIHCPNPLAELSFLMAPKHCPVVVTSHSETIRQKWLLPFYYPLQKMFLREVDRIIVPTINHIRYGSGLKYMQDKCTLIPFGLDPTCMEKNCISNVMSKELLNKYGPYAFFLGRLASYKGLDFLIEAMRDVNHNLIIAGDGPERSRLEALVAQYQLQDKVHFFGNITNQELFRALYHSCQMVVLPSVTPAENFGMIQLEAMCASKPVITTDLKSGVPVVGEPGRTNLIVPPRNPELLSEALNYLFDNPIEAKRMGTMGYQRFLNMYTMEKMIQGHVSLYTELIHQSRLDRGLEVRQDAQTIPFPQSSLVSVDKKKKAA
ncbi:MAG: glycosyltransferase [Bdellovibrio sp.]|nr:glycosyltransferase [Bdellovibrio sp.]